MRRLLLQWLSLCLIFFATNVSAQVGEATISWRELPREARDVVLSIKHGGPFLYSRDGVVFGNYERRLPSQKRGYYHEYTVPTPGVNHRGARRIVSGGSPAREFYYSDDHYRSFKKIQE